MKRSKSSSSQAKKNIIISGRNHKSKSTRKAIKLNTARQKIGDKELIHIQQITHSNKNIEKRLKNIKQGFQRLENNLNFNILDTIPKMEKEFEHPTTSCLTQQNVVRKLFQSDIKKTVKKKKCFVGSSSHRKISSNTHHKNTNSCLEARYHTCIYEQSLMSLMKVVSMQKKQISKLTSQISQRNRWH